MIVRNLLLFIFCLFLFAGNLTAEEQNDALNIDENPDQDESVQFIKEITIEKPLEENPQPAVEKKAEPVLSEVTGVLLERGTRLPIKKVALYVTENNLEIHTDASGKFSFSIKPGDYTLVVAAVGYEKLDTNITVREKERLELVIRVEPLTLNPYRIVVKGKKEKGEVSQQRVSIDEAMAVPGTNRDVLKVITNLPGVNSISVFNGYGSGLIIRGSAPEDSIYHVDDQWIPQLYHFGGLESIIEPELVESVDYYAGGFGAEYGEATGGVIKVNMRDPRIDRIGGFANLSLLSSSLMVEGPITEKDSFSFTIKRGLLDLYTLIITELTPAKNEISFSQYPVYYDGSFMYVHNFSKTNKFKLMGFGSYDTMKMTMADESENARFSNKFSNETAFGELIGEWSVKKNNFNSMFSPMLRFDTFSISFGPRSFVEFKQGQLSLSEKAEWKINDTHKLLGGIRYIAGYGAMNFDLYAPPKEGEPTYSSNYFEQTISDDLGFWYNFAAAYISDIITLGKFTVTPGVTALLSHDQSTMWYVDPRLSVKYKLLESLTLKAAGGLYSKLPTEDERIKPWGTNGLEPEHSAHAIAGAEWNITDKILLDVQGFYKHFFNMVVRPDTKNPAHYENGGIGRAYGAEVLLRHSMTDNFFGWLSYSFSVSRRKDSPEEGWRYFDMDITHNLTAVASYKINKYWQIGARFNLSTGTPYTDLQGARTIFHADNNSYDPIAEGEINTDRMPIRHQLDLRIDKYWLFDSWIFSTYLDVQNVYFQKNAIGLAYSADYSEKEKVTGLPIMIFLGFKGDF